MPEYSPPDVVDLIDNPHCDPTVCWTTGNVADAFPGVFTTFSWTFVGRPMEVAFRRMFLALGVFPVAEVVVPDRVEDKVWTAFAGRAAANIDQFRRAAGFIPGTSATAIEQQLFGYVRPDTVDENTMRRYPAILAKAPRAVITLPKRHDAMFADLRAWRLASLATAPGLDEAGCLELIAQAQRRFGRFMTEHLIVAFVSSGLADRLTELTVKAGLPGLESRLLSGVGSDENEVANDLWELAHERLDLSTFLDRHGYHGPNEGQLHGRSWREDPAPVLTRLADYRTVGADDPRAPRNRSAAQARLREAASAELAGTSRLVGAQVRLLVKLTARFLALREQGKAGYLLTFDVTKAAVRRLGTLLAARGVLADPEDVFHFSPEELGRGLTDLPQGLSVAELVAARRALFDERQDLRLPQAWAGLPELTKVEPPPPEGSPVGTVVKGLAASSGVVEGRARVVRDPATAEFDDGDILVCENTDPDWISLFMLAAAVVTDQGGMLSHGPIVTRELGLPCVCGTEDGSRRIGDGQLVRVDGDAGVATIIG
ncbi:PEP-utilizing enzyme [Sporichthya sp.]|uniref:PEP-utilizing enzyme n=1 Tax=Sporichthya sp. TaxID=65475 RepID=UPI0017EDF420|nr:PEP-utilizing enzyme [Sporichthya sp.]MBA3744364.1 phosphoenolpyruvate carboxykinase [Sporichthya sp.]